MYVYIYTHRYIHISMYVYIYVYVDLHMPDFKDFGCSCVGFFIQITLVASKGRRGDPEAKLLLLTIEILHDPI